MKYPFFASFIVFCLWLMYEIHKHRNMDEKNFKAYIDEEVKANNTRKKPLDDLQYITIPIDSLPTNILKNNTIISDFIDTIYYLSENPIVNLTGISNTELKLRYGAPNLELLTQYDTAYTTLVRTLYEWGKTLYENGYSADAKTVLEYAVSIKTDVSDTYLTLAKIYSEEDNKDKIKELISDASEINSLMSKTIINKLESFL